MQPSPEVFKGEDTFSTKEMNNRKAEIASIEFNRLLEINLSLLKDSPQKSVETRLNNYLKALNIYLSPPFKYETSPVMESRQAFLKHPDYSILISRPNVAGTPMQLLDQLMQDTVLSEKEKTLVGADLLEIQELLRSLKGSHIFFSQEEIDRIKQIYTQVAQIIKESIQNIKINHKLAA